MNILKVMDKKELKQKVFHCEGLSDFHLIENHMYAYDNEEDMELYFHWETNLDELFVFNSLSVDKDKFYNTIKENLDSKLFLMPKKVFFISSEAELNELLEKKEYELQGMDLDNTLGINWTFDSTIVINVAKCLECAKETEKTFGQPLIDCFNEILWTTLCHELRHMQCNLGLIIPESEIPEEEGLEDNVEEYGNNCFWDSIIYSDYKCFKLN